VPLLDNLIFTYGTTAEYSVGLVILITASRESEDSVVSKMRRDPTLGEKPSRSPPDIAGHSPSSALEMPLCYRTFINHENGRLTLDIYLSFCWDIPNHEFPKRCFRFNINIGLDAKDHIFTSKDHV